MRGNARENSTRIDRFIGTDAPALATSMPPGGDPGKAFLDSVEADSMFSGTAGIRPIPGPRADVIARFGLTLISLHRRR